MTSDAKVGLLLGLVFIFIIAFIINGMPSFHAKKAPDVEAWADTTNTDPPIGLASPQRNAISHLSNPPTALDANAASPQDANAVTSAQVATVLEPTSIQSMAAKTYVVAKGDTLGSIAIKFYGAKEGKKDANIGKISKASALKSRDRLQIGQKLTIPPLPASVQPATSNALPDTLRPADSVQPAPSPTPEITATQQLRQYTVQQGDSLWLIAQKMLGKGTRFTEIKKLNSLSDADNLTVGMNLKLPAK